jgi:hypothetical protein
MRSRHAGVADRCCPSCSACSLRRASRRCIGHFRRRDARVEPTSSGQAERPTCVRSGLSQRNRGAASMLLASDGCFPFGEISNQLAPVDPERTPCRRTRPNNGSGGACLCSTRRPYSSEPSRPLPPVTGSDDLPRPIRRARPIPVAPCRLNWQLMSAAAVQPP